MEGGPVPPDAVAVSAAGEAAEASGAGGGGGGGAESSMAMSVPMPMSMDIPIHDNNDRYELVGELGVGNFSVARLMRDKLSQELVAIKYIQRGEKVPSISISISIRLKSAAKIRPKAPSQETLGSLALILLRLSILLIFACTSVCSL
jgi:hypothetical protein